MTWFEKKFGDISMLVILIPGMAFLMTYAYVAGYSNYFNIPGGLISIEAKDIACMVLLVLTTLFCIFIIDNGLVKLFYSFFFKRYPIDSKVYQDQFLNYSINTLLSFFLLAFCIITNVSKGEMILAFSIPFIILVVFIIRHIAFIRKKKRNVSIPMVEDEEEKKPSEEFKGIVERIFGARLLLTILFVLGLYSFTTGFGAFVARSQKTFYSIDDRSEIVGVLISNNQIIAKYLDDPTLSKTEVIDISSVRFVDKKENDSFFELAKERNEKVKEERQSAGLGATSFGLFEDAGLSH